MEKEREDDWDWVTARAACDPELMLSELQRLAAVYMTARNATAGPRDPADRFKMNRNPGFFSVYDTGTIGRRAAGVKLRYEPVEFHILRDVPEPPAFKATLEFTANGDCRFRVGDELLQPWQFLRLALEPLFFPSLTAEE